MTVLLYRASSDSDSPWTQEKLSALQQEKTSVEAEWQEHVADQDIGTLKWRAVRLAGSVLGFLGFRIVGFRI